MSKQRLGQIPKSTRDSSRATFTKHQMARQFLLAARFLGITSALQKNRRGNRALVQQGELHVGVRSSLVEAG